MYIEGNDDGMHTVENAVIVPVFTLIIVALISVSGYMHDKVVMRNILNQLSIEYSRNTGFFRNQYWKYKYEQGGI